MNTTNNCSEAKNELIPGMDMLIDHMKKQSLEIERLRGENKQLKEKYDDAEARFKIVGEARWKLVEENNKLKESNEFIRKTCLMADEENTKLKTSNQQYIDMFNAVVESEGEKVDKINKLEEENKKLKKEVEDGAGMFNFVVQQEEEKVKRIDALKEELEQLEDLTESNDILRKTCLMADEEKKKLRSQIVELGVLCKNIDKNAYNSWKKITFNEAEREESSDEEEEVKLEWMCYEFVRYDYNPEDGSVYDTDGTKIADWDDQGDGKMVWVDKKYKKKHNRLAKKSMANLVSMATAPV